MTTPVTVLVVDDQQPFRDAARAVIDRLDGFEVVAEAESGEEAVEVAGALHPNLVLMDINMGAMDGITAMSLITAAHPEGHGAARAMEKALAHCGLQPDQVSYISAHGTGTPTNDQRETVAVKRVFKEAAYRIPISSIKSMLGHTMGAASAIEAAACALAIFSDHIPPTMHLEEPDPECDLDYVPNAARAHTVRVAMNNAYAFGGNNSSLILKQCEG